ncbi:hypothetical protein BDV10DRAFT_157056 [Aspergillus recurvatus]
MVVLDFTVSDSPTASGCKLGLQAMEKRKGFLTLAEAGLIGKIGLNSSGLAICLNALHCGAFGANRLTTHIMARYVLEHAPGFDIAVEMIRGIGVASTANMLMGEVSGEFGTVEATPLG